MTNRKGSTTPLVSNPLVGLNVQRTQQEQLTRIKNLAQERLQQKEAEAVAPTARPVNEASREQTTAKKKPKQERRNAKGLMQINTDLPEGMVAAVKELATIAQCPTNAAMAFLIRRGLQLSTLQEFKEALEAAQGGKALRYAHDLPIHEDYERLKIAFLGHSKVGKGRK